MSHEETMKDKERHAWAEQVARAIENHNLTPTPRLAERYGLTVKELADASHDICPSCYHDHYRHFCVAATLDPSNAPSRGCESDQPTGRNPGTKEN